MTIEINILTIAIAIIVLGQTFFAGYVFADTKTNNVIDILFALGICIAGLPVIIIYMIYNRILKELFNVFAIQDFFAIYFGKSLHNLEAEQIKIINDMYTRYLHMNARPIKRFFKLHTLSKISAINNFTLVDGKSI